MHVFPQSHDELAEAIGRALVAREARLAVAETTAGGLIAARLLSVPGASGWFDRGYVVYSAAARIQALGLDPGTLREHGAVSVQAVVAMAEAVRDTAGVTYGLAESGIAGPQGSRRSPRPVGSAVIALATPSGARFEEHVFAGARVDIMAQIAQRALEFTHDALR